MSVNGTYPVGLVPAGYQQLTISSVAKRLTVPAGSTRAELVAETNPIRYRNDGPLPTSSVGYLVKADVHFEIIGNLALKALRLIASGSDATLNVAYYKEIGDVTTTPVSSPSSSVSNSPSASISNSPSASPSAS